MTKKQTKANESEKQDGITHKALADQLGKIPMHVGRVRKEVCTDEDMDGRLIRPSGVKKILDHYKKEMNQIENAEPDIVQVEALRQSVLNPRWLLAYDRERKQKVKVSVPKNRKRFLSKPKTKFWVERGSEEGRFFYIWRPNLKQKIQ